MIIQISNRKIFWPDQSIIESQVDYNMCNNSDLVVFIYGHPFDPVSKTWISAEWVQKKYYHSKLDFVSGIEGIYSIIIHDSKYNMNYVISDRYGIYSLFYYKDDNAVIVSDDLQEMAGEISNISFNEHSIIEYLNFGFKLGTKTHFDSINEFDYARIYEINSELEISERMYWRFAPCSSADRMTKEEFRQTFNSHIDVAMGLPGNISMPLSCGIDTRMILSACLNKKDRFHCFTYGVPQSRDVKVASNICKHYKIFNQKYLLTDNLIQRLPTFIDNYRNVFNGHISIFMYLLHNMISCEGEQKVGEVMMSGVGANEIWRSLLWHWGTFWSEYHEVKSNSAKDVATTLFDIFSKGKNEILFEIYNHYSIEEIRDELINSIELELIKIEGYHDAVQKCSSFMFNNYLGNVASNVLKYLGKQMRIFPAYLHKDLLLQIPHFSLSERNAGEIQKYVISKNSRYLANILLNNGEIVSDSTVSKLKRSIWIITSKLDVVTKRILINMDLGHFFRSFVKETNYSEWTRHYSKTLRRSILDFSLMNTNNLFLSEEFDQAFIKYQDGDNSLTSFFSNIMAFELWSKPFESLQGNGIIKVN